MVARISFKVTYNIKQQPTPKGNGCTTTQTKDIKNKHSYNHYTYSSTKNNYMYVYTSKALTYIFIDA